MSDRRPASGRLHRGLYEAHLPVTDVARSLDYYVEKPGFEVGFGERDDESMLLRYEDGGTRWMLGLFRVDEIRYRHPAEYHVAFRVAGEDADRMVPWLEARGIRPVHPPTAPEQGSMEEPIVHGWMPAAAVFFRDPDGHLLELIADLEEPPRADVVYCPLSECRAES